MRCVIPNILPVEKIMRVTIQAGREMYELTPEKIRKNGRTDSKDIRNYKFE